MTAVPEGQAACMLPTTALHFAAGSLAVSIGLAVFVQGTPLDLVLARAVDAAAVKQHLAARGRSLAECVAVDRAAGTVTVTLDGISRTARRYPGHGCALLPPGQADIFATLPPEAAFAPAAPGAGAWPAGEAVALPSESPALAAALDRLFGSDGFTTTLLVAQHGRIVIERYREGFGPGTLHASWSAGKSLVATLVGVLVQEGRLAVDGPAPVAEWQGADDPRRAIRIADLLQMSSGLRFSGMDEPAWAWGRGVADHSWIYSDSIDAYAFARNVPLEHPPGTVGRYRNCDPLVLASLVAEAAAEDGMPLRVWLQRRLLDRLGIPAYEGSVDAVGQILFTGQDNMRARDWARLGQLHLQRGRWGNAQVIPEAFVDFVRTPAPGWAGDARDYGGLVWLNSERIVRPDHHAHLPTDTWRFVGMGGQETHVIPSLDAVIVRMGFDSGREVYGAELAPAMAVVVEALRGG